MANIIINVGHFAALSNISVKAAVDSLQKTFGCEVVDPLQMVDEEQHETCIATIDQDAKTLTLADSVSEQQESHRLKVVFGTSAFDLDVKVLELATCISVEGIKVELPAFVESAELDKLQYLLMAQGYRWLGHPGKPNDLKMARFLYAKYHPKHGRLLTMGQDTEASARRFDASPVEEVAFEKLIEMLSST